jgi:hypothetical protein
MHLMTARVQPKHVMIEKQNTTVSCILDGNILSFVGGGGLCVTYKTGFELDD